VNWQALDMVEPFSTNGAGNRTTPGAAEGSAPLVDCLGDSTTFGYGARDADTFPAVLAQELTKARGAPATVRNRGVPGYTSHSARLLAEQGDGPVAPVTVILVGFNDHFPAERSSIEELWLRRAAHACFASRVCSLLFDHLARPRAEKRGPLTEYKPSVSVEEFRSNLAATVRELRERGSEPILLVYPPILSDEKTRAGVASFWKHPRALVDANIDSHPLYQAATREVALAEGVRMVDLAPIFAERGNEALHLDWVHPNPAGYRLIAESVAPPVLASLARTHRPERSGAAGFAPQKN
jgi:lysophospholipase L1-like esterase